jgi:hypothetical protein
MKSGRLVIAVAALAAGASLGSVIARAQAPAPPAKAPAPAAPANCKAYGGGKCCDPAVTQHLAKESVFVACGESDATFLGEKGSKDTCRYVFKGEGKDEAFVEVYAPAQKDVPREPNDPFFAWKKIGKVFITAKALSPKSAPMLAASTGLWLPGTGYMVSVNASTKVCSKAEAQKLAKSMR